MPQLKDRDGKVRILDNTDTEVFVILDSGDRKTATVAATATSTFTAPVTLASITTGGTSVWGYASQTQADAICTAVNQIALALQTAKILN